MAAAVIPNIRHLFDIRAFLTLGQRRWLNLQQNHLNRAIMRSPSLMIRYFNALQALRGGSARRGILRSWHQIKAVFGERDINNLLYTSNNMPYAYGGKKTRSRKTRKPRRTPRKTTTIRKNGQVFKSKASTPSRKSRHTSLAKQVKQLAKIVSADNARHIYKTAAADKLSVASGQCSHNLFDLNKASNIETYMAQLRYYNPATPATLTTASGATGTYSRNVHFKNINYRLELRANYSVPCKVKVYLVTPKGDTNIDPVSRYNNGIDDEVITTADETTPLLSLSDIGAFKKQWSIKVLKDVLLDAGASLVVSHNTGSFDYDPSIYDTHALDYQVAFKASCFIVRMEGHIAHDSSVSGQVGLANAALDYQLFTRAEIIYDAGTNLDEIYISDGRDTTFTNNAMITNKPVADNQTALTS